MPHFAIHSFIGRMSTLKNRYWLGTEHFFNNNHSNIPSETLYRYFKSQTQLSRFEIFSKYNVLQQPHTFINSIPCLFITCKQGFNTHTGKRNPSIT